MWMGSASWDPAFDFDDVTLIHLVRVKSLQDLGWRKKYIFVFSHIPVVAMPYKCRRLNPPTRRNRHYDSHRLSDTTSEVCPTLVCYHIEYQGD